ncbi:MAG: hypothetical protein IPK32_05670 [Verrucomicrobiaceae bacterium]|nr:hypothetical protein [Verrucomicrobiaceae bacterium]
MTPTLDLLAHTALKGSAVLLATLLIGFALHRAAAARRYALWITAVSTLALLPLAILSLPAWRVLPKDSPQPRWQQNTIEEPIADSSPAEPVFKLTPIKPPVFEKAPTQPAINTTVLSAAPAPFDWKKLIAYLPQLWLTICVLLLLRLAGAAFSLWRLQRRLQTIHCPQVSAIARELGLKRTPQVLLGTAESVPMVWGVLHPRLLLPAGFQNWSTERLRGVLLHELEHLRRRDPLALWLAQWVKALHWFNPLAWLTLSQLRADQERACDDAVLRRGIRASDYAQSLLDLSHHSRLAPGLALCALTITRCAPVENRVKAILDTHRSREPLTARWLLAVALLALLFLLPVAMLHAIEGAKLRGRILDRHGKVLAETTQEKVRNYPLKALAAQVLGYTGKTKWNDPTPIGCTGLEKQYDADLNAGKDITLSLDARLQAITTRAMLDSGYNRGAAVVLDPRTGEILAMVSLPNYDPNDFIPGISHSDWEIINEDKDNPLLNRGVSRFAPGSIYKPFTGLAGIAAGVGDQKFTCNGSVKYGSSEMQCWIKRQSGGGHGELNLADALTTSCSCFFYQYGNAAGIDQIEKMGKKIGLGSRYGICEGESDGILPTPAWMKEYRPNEKWSEGYTANTAIGQGMVLVTPLQMAVLAATIANGGRVPEPSLQPKNGKNTWRADLTAEGLPEVQIEQLRAGMRQVVHSEKGTGKAAQSDKAIIAGKTGTAQNWRRIDGKNVEDNHTWFIGFAPYDKPTLAFAILKNGGKSGGADCAPIAKIIVEEALVLPADGSGEVKALEKKALEKKTAKIVGPIQNMDEEAIKAELKQAAERMSEGFSLSKLHASSLNHWVEIEGEASGMIQALAFRDKVIQIGQRHDLDWTFPVPETLADGQRVRFTIRGEPKWILLQRVLIQASLEKPQSNAASSPPWWSLFKNSAKLAKLPLEAVLPTEGMSRRIFLSNEVEISFSAPRDVMVAWLAESLGQAAEYASGWPLAPVAFEWGGMIKTCHVRCVCKDGKWASVWLTAKIDELFRFERIFYLPHPYPTSPRAPEGPTIPKNLPEERKPLNDRLALNLPKSALPEMLLEFESPSSTQRPEVIKPSQSFFDNQTLFYRVVEDDPLPPKDDDDAIAMRQRILRGDRSLIVK